MMKLNLRDLHIDILKHNRTYDVFDYSHNGIQFSVMFDVDCIPFKLILVKKRSTQYLILDVMAGYQINTYLGEKLQLLKDMLELKNGKTKFSTNQFFEEFNKKIPHTIQNKKISKSTISRVYHCEESEKIYIRELRNWDKYPELGKHATKENREKTRLLGNPRATNAVQVKFDEAYYRSLGLSMDKPLILVVMGSLGSSSINAIMKDVLPKIDNKYQILFVSGKNNYEEMKSVFPQDNIKVVDYVKQLDIIAKVDLIICRAGATTAAEITALGTPSILIPSPYVAHNHQFYNASVLVEKKAAYMIEEKDLNATVLDEKIKLIMDHPAIKEEMHQHALALGKPNASSDILDWCDEMKR